MDGDDEDDEDDDDDGDGDGGGDDDAGSDAWDAEDALGGRIWRRSRRGEGASAIADAAADELSRANAKKDEVRGRLRRARRTVAAGTTAGARTRAKGVEQGDARTIRIEVARHVDA